MNKIKNNLKTEMLELGTIWQQNIADLERRKNKKFSNLFPAIGRKLSSAIESRNANHTSLKSRR
tara:strand:+ start:1072 stop:1263 length:192 start_codon:yes stop_codon:yes gene_type:complete